MPAAASGGQVVEVSTNNYNTAFHGQIASQVTEHANLANSKTPIITKKFCYYHEERLKTIIYKISDGPNDKEAKEVIGAAYTYNDLGQVVLKSMHKTATMQEPAFDVGYSHHLHGMIKSISNRLFEQQIYYDTRKDGSQGYLNGNISELFHRFDEKTDSDLRGQKFAYDYLNRFKGNSKTANNGDGYKPWNNTETLTYDPNGNIITLQRSKEGFGPIDAMTYTYRNSGNIVSAIGDGSSTTQGFKARGNNAYTFDANGNLLTDANKGISTNILYNYLNLPTQIALPDANGVGKTLNYTYDATGQKLAMLVTGTTDRTLYTGEIEYNNQALATRIHTPMGYASRDADGLWQYTYNLKDYQGNVRVTAKYDPDTKLAVTTQKTDFFVLGAPIRYDSENFNRYLYQDKEQQPYSEFFDFGWRQYDPLVGRWFNNDPADQFASISPYAYVRNNPLMYGDPDGAFSLQGLWNGVKVLVNCTIIPYLQNPENLQKIALATGGFGGFAGLNAINQNNHPKNPIFLATSSEKFNPIVQKIPGGEEGEDDKKKPSLLERLFGFFKFWNFFDKSVKPSELEDVDNMARHRAISTAKKIASKSVEVLEATENIPVIGIASKMSKEAVEAEKNNDIINAAGIGIKSAALLIVEVGVGAEEVIAEGVVKTSSQILRWGNNSKGHLIKHANVLGFKEYTPQQLQKMLPQLRSLANQLLNAADPALTRVGTWHQHKDAIMYISNGKMLVTEADGTFITVINKTSNNWYNLAKPLK